MSDIVLLRDSKRFIVLGQDLLVGHAIYSKEIDPSIPLPELTVQFFLNYFNGDQERLDQYERRRQQLGRIPPAVHVSVLAGENQWWAEAMIRPETGDLWAWPALGSADPDESLTTPEGLLELVHELSFRTEPPNTYMEDLDIFDSPWGGMEPGWWDPDLPERIEI